MSKGGLEPPRPCGHQPLKLARLPIPPLRLGIATEVGTLAKPQIGLFRLRCACGDQFPTQKRRQRPWWIRIQYDTINIRRPCQNVWLCE